MVSLSGNMSSDGNGKELVSSVEFNQLKRDVNSLMHFRNKVLASFPFIYNHLSPIERTEFPCVSTKDNMSQTTKDIIPIIPSGTTADEDTDMLLYLLETIHQRSLQLSEKISILNNKKSDLKGNLVSSEKLSCSGISSILNESSPTRLKKELFIHIASTEKLVSRFWDHVKALEEENTKLKFELEKSKEDRCRITQSTHKETFYSSPYSPMTSLDDPLEKYKLKSRNRMSINESIVLAIDSTCSVLNQRAGIFPEMKSISNKKGDQVTEETSSTESSSGMKMQRSYSLSGNLAKGYSVPNSSERKSSVIVDNCNK